MKNWSIISMNQNVAWSLVFCSSLIQSPLNLIMLHINQIEIGNRWWFFFLQIFQHFFFFVSYFLDGISGMIIWLIAGLDRKRKFFVFIIIIFFCGGKLEALSGKYWSNTIIKLKDLKKMLNKYLLNLTVKILTFWKKVFFVNSLI